MDDYGFADSSLDYGGFDFGDGPKIKDDRNAATKIAGATLSGAKSNIASASFITNLVKKSLPKGYGSAMDLADESASTMKGLYNDVAREIKPVINDLKRTTKKMLPMVESKLPRDMAAKVKAWSESGDKAKYASMSPEEQRDASLQMQLGEIFQFQTKAAAQKNAEDTATSNLQSGIDHTRHRDMLGQLDAMRISLQQLASYQHKVDSGFQRKSLELQFRSYFLAQDALNEAKRFNVAAVSNLEGILKNTGLPDFVKLHAKERLAEVMRNKFIDGASEHVFGKRREFLKKFGGHIATAAKEKVSDFVSAVSSGIGAADMMGDAAEMAGSMGGSKEDMLGGMAGGIITDSISGKVAKKLRKLIPKGGKIDRGDAHAKYFVNNLSQHATNWAKNRNNGTAPERKGFLGKLASMFDQGGLFSGLGDLGEEAVGASNRTNNSLTGDKAGSMQDPSPFSRGASKSITEIIPGYLSRIYRELQIMRTGDTAIPLTSYDFHTNKFGDKNSVVKHILENAVGMRTNDHSKAIAVLEKEKKRVGTDSDGKSKLSEDKQKILSDLKRTHGKSDSASVSRQVDELIDEIGGKNLSPEERKALGQFMLHDNLIKNGIGSSTRLSNTDTFTGTASKHSQKFADLFAGHFKGNDPRKQEQFAGKYSDIGSGVQDSRRAIQDNLNTGNREALEELGLIDKDTDQINIEKLLNYSYGDEYKPTANTNSSNANTFSARKTKYKRQPRQHHVFSSQHHKQHTDHNPEIHKEQSHTYEPSNNDVLIKTFKETSSKTISETMSETLLRIEKKINEGIDLRGGGSGGPNGSPSSSGGHWWNKSFKDATKGAYDLGSKGIKGFGSLVRGTATRGSKLVGGGFKLGSDLITKGVAQWKEIKDVYITGELIPRLSAFKLKAGEYYDQASGEVIKSYKDIKGAVVDKDGKFILTVEEAKKAFIKTRIGTKLISALGSVIGKAKDIGDRILSKIPPAMKFSLDMVKKAYGLLKLPQDVYTKDKPDVPTLLAKTMKSGGYVSRVTSKTIKNTDDIDGPVFDELGNEVLTAADFAKGLFDSKGRPIRNGFGKITGLAKDIFSSGLGKLKKIGTSIKNGASSVGGFIKDKVTNGIHFGGISIGGINAGMGGGSLVLKRLTQIRDVVNDALPKKARHKFDDSADGTGSGIKDGLKKGVSKLGAIKDTVSNYLKDIYVKGEKDPRLSAWKFKAGKYVDDATGAVITKYKDIKGAVRDLTTNDIALKAEEIKDAFIRTPLGTKLISSFGSIFKGLKNVGLAALKGIGGALGLAGGAVGGLYNKATGGNKDKEEKPESKEGMLETAGGVAAGEVGGSILKRTGKGLLKGVKYLGGKGKALLGLGTAAAGAAGLTGVSTVAGGAAAAEGAALAGTAATATGLGTAAAGATTTATVGGAAAKWGVKAALKGGSKLLGPAGVAYGAYSTYDDIKKGNYGEAALDGVLTLGGLAVTMGMGAALFNPITLGAAAVAGLGYLAYKHFTKKNFNTLAKVRYAQYGFLPDDKDHFEKVMSLEDVLIDAVTYQDGTAKLDELKVKVKDVLNIFDVSLEKKGDISKLLTWFTKRFKPVFLTHLAAMNGVSPGKKLNDVEKLKPDELKKYLDIAKFPDGPYDITDSPFPDQKALAADKSVVTKLVVEAIDFIAAKAKEEKKTDSLDGGAVKATAAVTAIAAVNVAAPFNAVSPTTDKSKIKAAIKPDNSKIGLGKDVTMLSLTGIAVGMNRFSGGRISAMATIRYKTYGLVTLELERVKALDTLETIINKTITYVKGNSANWNGSVDKLLQEVGPVFGITDTTSNEALSWVKWFNVRFLPVYLNYLTAMTVATGKTDPVTSLTALKPQQEVDVATAIFTTKGAWTVTESPWADYVLNIDSATTDANMQILKDAAKQVVLDEVSSRKTNTGLNKSNLPNENSIQAKTSAMFSSTMKTIKDVGSSIGVGLESSGLSGLGRNIGSAVFDAKEAIGNAFSGGQEIKHPGNGTGGDINALPVPKGDGSWNALKDTISGAAKMAGVDTSLMAVMAAIESGFKSTVKAGTSTATGLYQFIASTWKTMISKYGSKYGIDPNTPPTDPRANALMGAEFIKENTAALKGAVNRPLTDTDIYLAHFLGAGGAKKLLSADPNAIAANLMPDAARANVSIFYKDGRPLSVSEVYAVVNSRVRSKGKQFGIDTNVLADASPANTKGATVAAAGVTPIPDKTSAMSTKKQIPAVAVGGMNAVAVSPKKDIPSAPAFAVSDQTPGVTAPVTKAPVADAVKPAVFNVSSTDPAVTAASAGFTSPRSRDLAAQAQYKKDTTAESLNGVDGTLKSSLAVQQNQLDIMSKILSIITIANSKKAPVAPAKIADVADSLNQNKVAREMFKAPVSMSKQS